MGKIFPLSKRKYDHDFAKKLLLSKEKKSTKFFQNFSKKSKKIFLVILENEQ